MTVSSGQRPFEADRCQQDFLNWLEQVPDDLRVSKALELAVRIVEFAAYESSPRFGAQKAAGLIKLAVDVDRTARDLCAPHHRAGPVHRCTGADRP